MISIVITCHGEARELPVMLGCLANQRKNKSTRHNRTGAVVRWAQGEYVDYPYETVVVFDGALRGVLRRESPSLGFSQIIATAQEGGVGHHTRGPGIEAARGEWIVLTNADNYFMSGWLDLVSRYTNDPAVGMIYWNCVNNLWQWSARDSFLARGKIDLSCVAVRSEISKKIGFPFREYDGDWDYIEACKNEVEKQGLRTNCIPCVLCVHN